MDYKQTAAEVLKYVGGKENIAHFEHCSTRLRFSLIDNAKADVKRLESIPGVIAVKMTGQCQVVIGNEVVEVYDAVNQLLGGSPNPDSESAEASAAKPKEKRKLGSVILDFIVGVFQPLIPAIAGAGMLKSLLLLLGLMNVLDPDGHTYKILVQIGDAALYFLPLLVAVTTANKLKVNTLVALAAVGALLLPNMTAMLGEGAQLFGLQIKSIAYAYQVFPAILTVLLYAQMEKWFTRITPKVIRIFFVPMMSLLITVPVSLLVLGPLGYTLGEGFSAIILTLFDKVGWIAVALLAAVLPLMVSVGMHKALIPYALSAMGSTGKELLYMPASLAHNIAESGACFAVAVRTKDKALRATAISAGISALFGITEPALYGVTLQNKKVLGSVMFSSLIGGAFTGIVGLQAYVLVGPGLASLSMFISEDLPRNIINAVIALVISFVVAFVSAFILGKDHKAKAEERQAVNQLTMAKEFKSPVIGDMIPLSEVKDEVFSSKAMGEGVAVIPAKGELYAPVDGKIEVIYSRNHAMAMRTANGIELLFHVGIDTVRLRGKYFEPQVQAGDEVKAGDLLLKFDLEKIIEEGYDPVTIAIVTNKDKYAVEVADLKQVNRQDTLMVVTALEN
ncbi:MAG: beta-glucoside-specific PTS transporter subunit IIABC [Paenibacillus macerans]|uniref:PTS beta-glucoside transporter subunit EIIBCA n=1 Tax=Paenibacillus macerans TaxID=44252 RepID=A0A090YMV7_PAEMA|nr:beta-glucoside-specific PTS transporter subunit IIABC [Paenibacillus macerans]KFM93475.1 PTS system, beta-glucoside-specific IIABC component family protein [Paenibacillus macerans]MCY7556968.1 beta-glucoside-specific PTS transporter subunit IIABC [Paenibacillus macerans]MDU7476206.1 beta-glucoside-specific PTS transporter subunit IIABC [Paenibacillus macerans]MEC0154313.1 beta-glucoside-specific PTS transporter subunit IIABC [Paenibacillus macerans]MEC0330140.1 beta-glucoside-specific PTS t